MSIVGFRFCQEQPASHGIECSKSLMFCKGRDGDSYGGMHSYTCLTYPNLEYAAAAVFRVEREGEARMAFLIMDSFLDYCRLVTCYESFYC
jgi:hypothetical protein